MPQLGLTMTEGEVVRWLVGEGAAVAKGQVIAEIQTDKISTEIEAPEAGILGRILVPQGQAAPVAAVLALLGTSGEAAPARSPEASQPTRVAALRSVSMRRVPPEPRASPYARRLAAELQVDLSGLPRGTGPGGRIVSRDVRACAPRPPQEPRATPIARRLAAEKGVPLASIEGSGRLGRITRCDVERSLEAPPQLAVVQSLPLAGIRRVIADRMSGSAHAAAAVTLTTEADAGALVSLRERISGQPEFTASDLPLDAIFVRIAALTLSEFPRMNARLTGEAIELLRDVNVAFAVHSERGLLTPVIGRANSKSLAEVADEMATLVERALQGRSRPEDLAGGTFTLTNLGIHDIDAFTPIINPPQCAILGIGRIRPRPAVWNGQVCVRSTVWLSLTFDHRLVDGSPAAQFLSRIKGWVEHPEALAES